MFNRITIIGLGLIGGSLGLAIKEKKLAKKIVGVSRRQSTIRRALSLGVVDIATRGLKKGVKGSDLVILTAPVLKIIDIAGRISPYLKRGAVVIDAGSTKRDIVKSIESILQVKQPFGCCPALDSTRKGALLSDTVGFVGSHPLAGSEKSGLIYADKHLFRGAHCILTRTRRTNSKALNRIEKFWTRLGMKVEIMSPQKHDRLTSRLSHLPHAVSVGLSNACNKLDLHLAAGGFKDTTRIAAGDPELWKDVFITNRENIVRDIKLLKKELSKIETALRKNDSQALLKLFKKAKAVRDSI